MKKVFALSLLCMLLTAVSALGQTGEYYHVTGSSFLGGNDNNCMNHNCLLPVAQYQGGSQAQLRYISSGQDMFVLGIGMGNDLWNLPVADSSTGKTIWVPWSPGAGKTWEALAVENASEIYLLEQDSTCGPAGTNRAFYWDGANLTSSSLCVNDVNVTGDDTLFGFWNTGGNDGFSWYATNAGGSFPNFNWVRVPGDGWTKVVGLSATAAYGIMNNTLYLINLTSNTYTPVPNTAPVKDVAVTGDQWLSVLTISGTNNVYMMDLTAQTPSWSPMVGNLKNIYGGIHYSIFGTDGNYYPYHYLSHSVTSAVVTQGYYQCPAGGCPRGSFHTLQSTVDYPTSYGQGQNSYGTLPQNQATVTAYATSGACDVFYGDPTSPECKPKISKGQVQCVVMGLIFARSLTLDLPSWTSYWGSGLVKSVTRQGIGGTYIVGMTDNCSPAGYIVEGVNAPKSAIVYDRTDTALLTQTKCLHGYGWVTYCIPPVWATFSGNYILDGHTNIPYPHCTQ